MALTDENSVLILGAGASAPFGVPVGSALIDTIARNLSKQLFDMQECRQGANFLFDHLSKIDNYEAYNRFPYLQPLLWLVIDTKTNLFSAIQDTSNIAEISNHIQKMSELRGLLDNQTSDSIDDFIIMNKSYADYVKICIAAEFINALYPYGRLVSLDQRYSPYNNKLDWDEIFDPEKEENKTDKPEPERNWIHRLINLIRLGVIEEKVTPDNKVKIITFNYDSILEYVLEKQFLNTQYFEELKKKNPDQKISYEDYIEIIHVHGQCGKLEKKLVIPSKTCWEWAKDIHVIREGDDNLDENNKKLPEEVLTKRKDAQDWIKNATKIYAAGFAFAKANTDLIGLKDGVPASQQRVINYCNFNGDIGLRNAADKFIYKYKNSQGVESDHAYTKVIEEPNIGVSDWIGVGTLGELP